MQQPLFIYVHIGEISMILNQLSSMKYINLISLLLRAVRVTVRLAIKPKPFSTIPGIFKP